MAFRYERRDLNRPLSGLVDAFVLGPSLPLSPEVYNPRRLIRKPDFSSSVRKTAQAFVRSY